MLARNLCTSTRNERNSPKSFPNDLFFQEGRQWATNGHHYTNIHRGSDHPNRIQLPIPRCRRRRRGPGRKTGSVSSLIAVQISKQAIESPFFEAICCCAKLARPPPIRVRPPLESHSPSKTVRAEFHEGRIISRGAYRTSSHHGGPRRSPSQTTVQTYKIPGLGGLCSPSSSQSSLVFSLLSFPILYVLASQSPRPHTQK
jgi:hypothetical protein